MAADLNSFICKRPFFANQKSTFANLSAGVSCWNPGGLCNGQSNNMDL